MDNHKKPVILCHSCKNVDWVLLSGSGAKMLDECYYPDNAKKFGHATKCEEYESKKEEQHAN